MPTSTLPPIRILTANLSEGLSKLVVQMVEGEPRLKLVAQVQGQLEVLMAAALGVDVVVLGAPQVKPAPGIASHLLNEFPLIKIVVLSTTDDSARGYWLGVYDSLIDRSTTDTLLNGIDTLFRFTPSL